MKGILLVILFIFPKNRADREPFEFLAASNQTKIIFGEISSLLPLLSFSTNTLKGFKNILSVSSFLIIQ